MTCNAKELSPLQKSALESLLGRHLSDSDIVSVRTIETVPAPDEHRLEVARKLEQYFAEVDASRQPASDQESEEILNEALRSARPSYRPIS